MSIHQVYFDITKKAQSLYGENTVVFMQVGTFFEIYAVYDEQTQTFYGSKLEHVAKCCDLATPKKQFTVPLDQFIPNCPRNGNLHMCGFQPVLFERELSKLEEVGYTILIYVQTESTTNSFHQVCPEWFINIKERRDELVRKDEEEPPIVPNVLKNEKGTDRILVEIISPGSSMYAPESRNSNYICSLWFSRIRSFRRTSPSTLTIGIGLCNVYTSETQVYQFQLDWRITPSILEPITRLLTTYQPREYIIVYDLLYRNEETIEQEPLEHVVNRIENYIGLNDSTPIHRYDTGQDTHIHVFQKQVVQQKLLEQWYQVDEYHSFHSTTLLSEYPIGTMAFVHLLNFLQEHNSHLVKQLHTPTIGTPKDTMILANHSLQQLNIIGTGNHLTSSVERWVNRCKTPMGRRRLHKMITHPSTNSVRLNAWYNAVEYARSIDLTKMRQSFEGCRDIERDFRHIVMNTLQPRNLGNFIKTFHKVIDIVKSDVYEWKGWNTLFSEEQIQMTISTLRKLSKELYSFLTKYIRQDVCQMISGYQFDTNIFHCVKGEPELESLYEMDQSYKRYKWILYRIQQSIQHAMKSCENKKKPTEYTKIHETDKQIYIVMTKRRAQTLEKYIKKHSISFGTSNDSIQQELLDKIQQEFIHSWKIHSDIGGKTSCALIMPTLKQVCRDISEIQEKRTECIRNEYFAFLKRLNHSSMRIKIQGIVDCLGMIDIVLNHAFISNKYGYTRPVIQERTQSFIQVKKLRHILIEQIQQDELYVPNDITMDEERGILLYGTNAVGKSSLIRSLGISIVLAQSGMYVPCQSFEYSPFTKLFTRILGNDNIFKGLSTFMVEMTELNTILNYMDNQSLVLGDELCSGTEIPSAISIFTSALEELMEYNSCFMFATHFHELTRMKRVKEMIHQGLRMMHLSVQYDAKTGVLIYDRRLKDGSGHANYGLEVCKAIHMPFKFLERANQIRLEICPEEQGIQAVKETRYSSKRLKTVVCEVCNENITTEIHHLTPQQCANITGFINEPTGQQFHKNHPANLISVCNECHSQFHSGTDSPYGHKRVKTTKGYKVISRT